VRRITWSLVKQRESYSKQKTTGIFFRFFVLKPHRYVIYLWGKYLGVIFFDYPDNDIPTEINPGEKLLETASVV
jgi:hypothetical protein